MRHNDPRLTGMVSHDSLLYISTYPVGKVAIVRHPRSAYFSYFSPCSISFVLIGEYVQYSPRINFHLIIPSNIPLQCCCSAKNDKKQHHEGNMAVRIISILTPFTRPRNV
jgi:hypothetical protein